MLVRLEWKVHVGTIWFDPDNYIKEYWWQARKECERHGWVLHISELLGEKADWGCCECAKEDMP